MYLINAGSIARAVSRASVTGQSIDRAKTRTGFVVARHDDDVGAHRYISGDGGCSSVVAKLLRLEFASARKQDDPNYDTPEEIWAIGVGQIDAEAYRAHVDIEYK